MIIFTNSLLLAINWGNYSLGFRIKKKWGGGERRFSFVPHVAFDFQKATYSRGGYQLVNTPPPPPEITCQTQPEQFSSFSGQPGSKGSVSSAISTLKLQPQWPPMNILRIFSTDYFKHTKILSLQIDLSRQAFQIFQLLELYLKPPRTLQRPR